MDVKGEIKRAEQMVSNFLDKMNALTEAVKEGEKKGNIEDILRQFVDPVRLRQNKTEKLKTNDFEQISLNYLKSDPLGGISDPNTPKNRLKNEKNNSKPKKCKKQIKTAENLKFLKNHNELEPTEVHSDDDHFLQGWVSQKPKKQVCLSIKKLAKNRSKCAKGINLLDTIPDSFEVRNTPTNQGKTHEKTDSSQDLLSVLATWTIKIKESSAQHTDQVKITGCEQLPLKTPRHGRISNDNMPTYMPEYDCERSEKYGNCISEELVDKAKNLEMVKPADVIRISDKMSLDENIILLGTDNFQECRVVVRKLSTSHKIFQPKVVRRKLTDAEISQICGLSQESTEHDSKVHPLGANSPREPRNGQTVRYTSLILEPARKFPRMFSTVKRRCSIMKLVLSPPPAVLKPENKKLKEEPTTNNEMVKSMFKTKSKCIQEWRSRGRTKDVIKCEFNQRKSLNLPKTQERHTIEILNDKAPVKGSQGPKRSKCILGSRNTPRTIDTSGNTYLNIKLGRLTEKLVHESKTTAQSELSSTNVEEKRSNCYSSNAESKQSSERQQKPNETAIGQESLLPIESMQKLRLTIDNQNESKNHKNVNKPCSGACDTELNLNQPGEPVKGSHGISGDAAPKRQTKHLKTKLDRAVWGSKEEQVQQKNIPNSINSPVTPRGSTKMPSYKKMVVITPTRLKYCVKTRAKPIENSSPIQNGRVTRSRIRIEHCVTPSKSTNGKMFPGSQLTFLIQSFRR